MVLGRSRSSSNSTGEGGSDSSLMSNGGAAEFHLHADMSEMGRDDVTVKTTLDGKWIKKPLGKALVGPFVSSFNKSLPKGAKKLTLAQVTAVTVNDTQASLNEFANVFVNGAETVVVSIKFGTPNGTAANSQPDGDDFAEPSHSISAPRFRLSAPSRGKQDVVFEVYADLSDLGYESNSFRTTLDDKWLKRPLGKALVDPFVRSFNTNPPNPGAKLSLAQVGVVSVDGAPASLSQLAKDFVHGPDAVQINIKFGHANGVSQADADDASEPSTPAPRFSLGRKGSSRSTPAITGQFHVIIGESTFATVLTKRMLKKPLQKIVIDPFLKHYAKAQQLPSLEIDRVVVDGVDADTSVPAANFVLLGRVTRVQILQPGEEALDLSQLGLEDNSDTVSEQGTEPESPLSVNSDQSPSYGNNYDGKFDPAAPDEAPVFRTVNSAALARARASRKGSSRSSGAGASPGAPPEMSLGSGPL